MFKVFGKKDKRIAELEKENKKLQEEKDGALMLYNTTIKNHEQLEHEYRSLKAGSEGLKSIIEGKNKKVRELEDKVNKMIGEIRFFNTEVKEYRRLFEIIENKDIVKFRKLRGEALNTKSKRIRDKKLKQLEAHTEKIFKMIEEYKKLSLKKYSKGIKFTE